MSDRIPPFEPLDLDPPIAPEMNLYLFFREVAGGVDELQRVALEHLLAAGTARGWFPAVEAVSRHLQEEASEQEAEAAILALRRKRLLHLDSAGGIHSIVSGITHAPTGIRCLTSENVPFHVLGALDALTIAPTLQKGVLVRTTCGVSGVTIELELDAEGHVLRASPHEVTAFVSGWDGHEDLPGALGRSRFFAGDAMLHEWQAAHGDPDGLPLTEDTIRSVGLEMASALAALYTRMSIR